MSANPTHRRPLVDLKVASTRTKQAQTFRLQEKKGRPEEIGQNGKKKPTRKHLLCPHFKEVWSQRYGVSVSLCSVQHILSQKLYESLNMPVQELCIQKMQPQLRGTSARPPVRRDHLQQKELNSVLPEGNRLVCTGRTRFPRGSAAATPHRAHAGHRRRRDAPAGEKDHNYVGLIHYP